jgi:hypothetical protein
MVSIQTAKSLVGLLATAANHDPNFGLSLNLTTHQPTDDEDEPKSQASVTVYDDSGTTSISKNGGDIKETVVELANTLERALDSNKPASNFAPSLTSAQEKVLLDQFMSFARSIECGSSTYNSAPEVRVQIEYPMHRLGDLAAKIVRAADALRAAGVA